MVHAVFSPAAFFSPLCLPSLSQTRFHWQESTHCSLNPLSTPIFLNICFKVLSAGLPEQDIPHISDIYCKSETRTIAKGSWSCSLKIRFPTRWVWCYGRAIHRCIIVIAIWCSCAQLTECRIVFYLLEPTSHFTTMIMTFREVSRIQKWSRIWRKQTNKHALLHLYSRGLLCMLLSQYCAWSQTKRAKHLQILTQHIDKAQSLLWSSSAHSQLLISCLIFSLLSKLTPTTCCFSKDSHFPVISPSFILSIPGPRVYQSRCVQGFVLPAGLRRL